MQSYGNVFIRKDREMPLFDGLGSGRTVTNSSLGMDSLSRFRVLLDFPAKKMYLQPVTPLTDPAAPPPVPGPQPPTPTK